jgi:hypothetical protein
MVSLLYFLGNNPDLQKQAHEEAERRQRRRGGRREGRQGRKEQTVTKTPQCRYYGLFDVLSRK